MRRPEPYVPAAAFVVPLLVAGWVAGCMSMARPSAARQRLTPRVQALDVSGAAEPVASAGPVVVQGARNECVTFAVQLTDLPPGGNYSLRLRPPRQAGADAAIPAAAFEAHQIVTMPVDVNRAGYVR